jgi:hypothetical protein
MNAPPANLELRWSTVAIGATAVAVAAITALIVLYGSRTAALESTAILLAIVAFIVQLMVFIAQAIQSNASAVRLEQIAGELSSNLGVTREQLGTMGSELREVRQSQTELALRVAADQTAEDLAERPTTDPHEIAKRIRDITETLLEERQRSTTSSPRRSENAERDGNPRSFDRIGAPTQDERDRTQPILAALTDDAFSEIVRIKAIDNTIPRHKTKGAWTHRTNQDPVLCQLDQAGLITVWADTPPDRQRRGETFVQLKAPLGLEAGRVIHEDGSVSAYLNKEATPNAYRTPAMAPASDTCLEPVAPET